MPATTVVLRNPSGLHARPATTFAAAAAAAPGEVTVAKGDTEVNAKSVLSVLTLDCRHGDEVTITVDGDDAAATLAHLVELVESGLGERTGA